MSAQQIGGLVFAAFCTLSILLVGAMAANEWRQSRAGRYAGLAGVGAAVLLARLFLGAAVFFAGGLWPAICWEWAVEALTLALLVAAFVWGRRMVAFLLVAVLAAGGGLALCFPSRYGLLAVPWGPSPGLLALLLVSAYALFEWYRRRAVLSFWLAGALGVSLLGAVLGLGGLLGAALAAHAAALALFVVGTYRLILADRAAVSKAEVERLTGRLSRQVEEAIAVLEAGQAISEPLALETVLERASETMAGLVGADWAYVLLPATGGDEYRVTARYGWWGQRKKQDPQVYRPVVVRPSDYSLLRHAILRQRQVLASEPKDYDQFGRLHDLLGRPQSGPTLVQPLVLGERIVGLMLLGCVGRQRCFGPLDLQICQAMAVQVATSIEHAQAYRQAQGRAQELAVALRDQEQTIAWHQAIVESLAVGVIVLTEDGGLQLINAAARHMLGLSSDEENAAPADFCRRLVAEVGEGGGPLSVEWQDRVFAAHLTPLPGGGSGAAGWAVVLRDVTALQRREAARKDYVAGSARELRAGLLSLREHVESLLRRGGTLPSQQRALLDDMLDDTEGLICVTSNLVVASGLGVEEIKLQPVDVRAIMEQAVRAAKDEAAEQGVEINLSVPTSLSPALGDPEALQQIVDNLLGNALLLSAPGGRVAVWAAEARLEADRDLFQDYIVVSVRDSGAGIELADQARVFEGLYRVGDAAAADMGMALVITRELVRAQGGRVWVESQPGAGSTFSFTIPAASRAVDEGGG